MSDIDPTRRCYIPILVQKPEPHIVRRPLTLSGSYMNSAIWSVIEPCTGVVSACLPVMSPLLRKVRLPRMKPRRQQMEPLVPKVSWLRPNLEMENLRSARFKRLDNSTNNEGAMTNSISTSRKCTDADAVVVLESMVSKTNENNHANHSHKHGEPTLPQDVVIRTTEIDL